MKKALIVALSSIAFGWGCTKEETRNYPFVIQVINEEGRPAQNVLVQVNADVPNSIPDFLGSTDMFGEVRFEYRYEAVLKVQATRGNPPSWIGCGFVRLENNTEVRKIIVIQPYDPSVGGC
jgi:hypothetical protein